MHYMESYLLQQTRTQNGRTGVVAIQVKGSAHSKNENLYFVSSRPNLQPILVSCEAPFRSNLHENTGPVSVTGPV